MTHVCSHTHPDTGLRCWVASKSDKHDPPHFAVLPNADTNIPTRPQMVQWTDSDGGSSEHAAVGGIGPAPTSGPGQARSVRPGASD